MVEPAPWRHLSLVRLVLTPLSTAATSIGGHHWCRYCFGGIVSISSAGLLKLRAVDRNEAQLC